MYSTVVAQVGAPSIISFRFNFSAANKAGNDSIMGWGGNALLAGGVVAGVGVTVGRLALSHRGHCRSPGALLSTLSCPCSLVLVSAGLWVVHG